MSHKKISDLEGLLHIDNYNFDSLNLDFDFKLTHPLIIKNFSSLKFKNCIFNDIKIENIKNDLFEITFINCIFKSNVEINNNKINNLNILWDKKDIDFKVNTEKFCVSSNVFDGRVKLKNLIFQKGHFYFIGNVFTNVPREIHAKREISYDICEITECDIFNGSFNNNVFYMPFNFKNNILKYDTEYSGNSFINNLFQKSCFSNTDFGNNTKFNNCDFLGTTLFDNITTINHEFNSCKFNGYTHFSSSKISNLSIIYSSFDRPVSFREAEFNNLRLSDIKFEKGAYFDDIKIKNVENKIYIKTNDIYLLKEWKHTLRIIKQELQKTENKIDFNRFRSYELAAHYKELSLWSNFKDTSILWSTKWTTDFGLSWTRAFWFTITSGFIWFSILYRIENSGTFNSQKINEFFVGAFRFFLVTDFFNPLENDRSYLESGWSWLIFILGKIFIAFGIYEMIQSFRKFKA